MINLEKSHLVNAQVLQYLRAKIDTQAVTVSLPGTKTSIVLKMKEAVQRDTQLLAAECLRLLGIMTLTIPIVNWVQWNPGPLKVDFLDQ